MIKYLIMIHYYQLPPFKLLTKTLIKKWKWVNAMSYFLKQNKLTKSFKSSIIKYLTFIDRGIRIWVRKKSISILKIFGSSKENLIRELILQIIHFKIIKIHLRTLIKIQRTILLTATILKTIAKKMRIWEKLTSWKDKSKIFNFHLVNQ